MENNQKSSKLGEFKHIPCRTLHTLHKVCTESYFNSEKSTQEFFQIYLPTLSVKVEIKIFVFN